MILKRNFHSTFHILSHHFLFPFHVSSLLEAQKWKKIIERLTLKRTHEFVDCFEELCINRTTLSLDLRIIETQIHRGRSYAAKRLSPSTTSPTRVPSAAKHTKKWNESNRFLPPPRLITSSRLINFHDYSVHQLDASSIYINYNI